MDAYYLDEKYGVFYSQLPYLEQNDYGTKACQQKVYVISISYEKNLLAVSCNKGGTR